MSDYLQLLLFSVAQNSDDSSTTFKQRLGKTSNWTFQHKIDFNLDTSK